MQTFKEVLIKACKEEIVNLVFARVCIFIYNLKNMFLFIFRQKRYYMPDDGYRMKL